MGILDGRIAIITGAGDGLGRQHALTFANEGAQLVLNDINQDNLDAVVKEVIESGGAAVAVAGNVADMALGRALTEKALDEYGDLHIVVNNAGIIRDAMMWNMTEEQFDVVIAVHLKGAFAVAQPAVQYWRAQSKEGKIADRSLIQTSSGSGLHGNPGQWNYSAVKAGLAIQASLGAREFERIGVRVNAIAPVARTSPVLATPRLNDIVGEPVDEDVFDRYHPGNIAPLVAYLASEDCPFNGQSFGVYGGFVGLYQGYTVAHEIRADRQWTPSELASVMSDESFPRSVEVTRGGMPEVPGEKKKLAEVTA